MGTGQLCRCSLPYLVGDVVFRSTRLGLTDEVDYLREMPMSTSVRYYVLQPVTRGSCEENKKKHETQS